MAGPVKPSDPNRRDSNQKGGGNDKKRAPWSYLSIVMWAVMLVFLLQMCNSSMENASVETVPFSTFRGWVEEGQVATVELTSNLYAFTLKEGSPALAEYAEKIKEAYGKGGWGQFLNQFDPKGLNGAASAAIKFQTVPMPGLASPDLPDWLSEHGVEKYETVTPTVEQYLMSAFANYVLPILLMVGGLLLLYRYMFKKMGAGGGFGGIGGVGKSNAKVYVEKKTGVTFKDVAGQDEAKESLEEIIDFLHNPGKYTEIGAKLPKGALLVGPPAPARPCWRRPWRARPTSPSSPSPAPTSWRCSWAWARPGSGTCSRKRPKWPPASSSSTRSTPSANPGTTAWAATTSGSRP